MTLDNYAALLLWVAAFCIGLAIAAWTDRPHTPKRAEPNEHDRTAVVLAHNAATCRACRVYDREVVEGVAALQTHANDRTQS